MKLALFVSTSAAMILLSPLVLGQERPVSGTLTLSSLVSDNGFRKNDDKKSERQDIYQLGLVGAHENSYMVSAINYQARARRFEEGSQKSESAVEGKGSLTLGQQNHPAALHITHVRKRLLNTPEALDISNNRQERDILSISPELRLGSPFSYQMLVQGQLTQIRFTESRIQDADTKGGVAVWSRPLSPISTFQLSMQKTSTDFLYLPEQGYDYTRADVLYNKALRQWNYQLRIGYNQSERQEETHESPALSLDIAAETGHHTFLLNVSSRLTDTATGNGAGESIGNDGLGRLPEQIDRQQASVSWTSTWLCGRCTVRINTAMTHDDYLEKDIQSTNSQHSLNVSYQLSPLSAVEWRYSMLELTYAGSEQLSDFAGNRDYQFELFSISYRRTFFDELLTEVFVRQESRQQELLTSKGYRENIVGISLTHAF